MTVTETLLVRADAAGQIGTGRMGTGHVMRCLTLAEAWLAAGDRRVVFVGRCPIEGLRGRIRDCGAEFVPLRQCYPDPADLRTTLAAISSDTTWVALDGYHFDATYRQSLRRTGARLLVVDDGLGEKPIDADVILNQNLGAERSRYACDPQTVLLLGTRYAMLRPDFQRPDLPSRQTPPIARRILVTLGGADPANLTATVIEAVEQLDFSDWEATVVMGAASARVAGGRSQGGWGRSNCWPTLPTWRS